jgi:uncharacterized peroxidase-related enzyme
VIRRRIDSLLDDYRRVDFPTAEVALQDFCLKLALHPLSVSASDIERLREHGIGDESIIEAALITALAIYRCTLSVGSHPEPDDKFWKLPPKREVSLPEPAADSSSRTRPHTGPHVRAPYLSPKTFAPFDALAKSHGFTPNFFRAQTLRPDLLAAEVEVAALVLLPEDILTWSQKETILLAVSAANLNSYCVAIHCNLLRGLGMSTDEGDQIALDHHRSSLSDADKALLDFAIKLGSKFPNFRSTM